MAFNLQNWSNLTTGLNKPIVTQSGVTVGINSIFSYQSNVDSVATIAAANYFTQVAVDCAIGDLIFVNGADSEEFLTVQTINTTVFPATITTSVFAAAGTIGTSNITNNAVTVAKMQQSTANGFFANPTGSTANVEQVNLDNATLVFSGTTAEVGVIQTANIANNAVGSAQLSKGVLQVATGTLSTANIEAMYATPVAAVGLTAPGAGEIAIIKSATLNYTFGTAAFAAGGAITLQYGNTAHAAGVAAITPITQTGFTDQTVSMIEKTGGVLAANTVTAVANTALYWSNPGAAFTTGGGSITYYIEYIVVAAA